MLENTTEKFIFGQIPIPEDLPKYHNLHAHSSFSNINWFLDGYWTPMEMIKRGLDIWYEAMALTDHGSVSGHIQLIRGCKEKWIKPLCWCEMYVVDSLDTVKKVRDKIAEKEKDKAVTDEFQTYSESDIAKAKERAHFNVIAKNQRGLHDLWKFVSLSWTEGYYYRPTIDWKELAKKPDNCWFWTACEIWPLWRVLDHYDYNFKQELLNLIPYLNEYDEEHKNLLKEYKRNINQLIVQLKEIKKGDYKDEDLLNIEEQLADIKEERYYSIIEYDTIRKQLTEWNLSYLYSLPELADKYDEYRELEKTLPDTIKDLRNKMLEEGEKGVEEKLKELHSYFWDNLYVEIIPEKAERARWKFLLIHKVAKKLWIRILCTNDSHSPWLEDTFYQDLLYAWNIRRWDESIRFEDKDRSRYSPETFFIHSKEQMYERMVDCFPEFSKEDIYEMMENTYYIVQNTETVHEEAVPAVAYFDINQKEGERHTNFYSLIQKKLIDGWKFRNFDSLSLENKKIYWERVKRELNVILNKWYIDYFLIMADIMDWCDNGRPFIENFDKWYELNGHSSKWEKYSKEECFNILNSLWKFDKREPLGTWIARWSAWWSLIAYLLRITNIDPIPGWLLFERFIDYTRWNVYYEYHDLTYTKKQFKEEYIEENLDRLTLLEEKYKPLVQKKIDELLERDPWYDKLQCNREFWLLDHNQQFTREKEYFYTCLEKLENNLITPSSTNESNSIFTWLMWLTTKEPEWDFVVSLTDIPDIDSDFEDIRRNEVYEYLQHRYGIMNSCRIATYGKLKAFSAIDLLSKIFFQNPKDIKELKEKVDLYLKEKDKSSLKADMVDDFFSLEDKWLPFIQKYPWLSYLKKLLDQTVSLGMHAAWMIVHNNQMSNYWATYITKDRETWEQMTVICWDSIEAESLWLMKLDILGLNTVTSIKRINELVQERHWWDHHWQRIPNILDDPKTKQGMEKSDMVWLFQLEWSIMTFLSKEIKPSSFHEVVTIAAWWRPWPLDSAIKIAPIKFWEAEPYYYNNKTYEEITKDTYWILIYQEDIMAVSKKICGYDDKMVWYIRKLISKMKQDEVEKLEPDFIERLIKNWWLSEMDAKWLWSTIKSVWNYCFNKCLHKDSKIKVIVEQSTLFSSDQEIELTIEDLYLYKHLHDKLYHPIIIKSLTYNEETKELEYDEIKDIYSSWEKEIYELELEDGTIIKSSKDHKFLTNRWWLRLEEITEDDYLYTN